MLSLTQVLLFLPLIFASPRIDPLVNINQGLIRGLRADNGEYSMFLGIPYGLVNESNPFGSPIPHPGFEDTFEAFDDSVICPQAENNVALGSLDCLRLNIFVPNTATSQNRLPVMVWIHGGGFVIGSGNRDWYSPEFLVRNNVIVVSFNYRLGPYGFMCLDTPEIPGNAGLKDQVLALRWINENIGQFGGDANQITVFGESAGSISIDFHLLSNQEKLFDRAIMQSGSASLAGGINEADRGMPLVIARRLGLETNDFEEAVSFLAGQDPLLVVGATYELGISDMLSNANQSTQPCVEKYFEGVEQFIHDLPANIKSTKLRNIPLLQGYNNNEMQVRVGVMAPAIFESFDFKETLDSAFGPVSNDLADIVRHFYIGDDAIGENVEVEIADFFSDIMAVSPMEKALSKYIEDGARVIYKYVFSYDGGRNFAKVFYNVTGDGAVHADELGYLFGSSVLTDQPNAEDQLMIDRITALWTNFAKYGNPTPQVTSLLPVTWIPVTESTRPYLNIDSELSLQSRPFHDRAAFWELFYKVVEYSVEYRKMNCENRI